MSARLLDRARALLREGPRPTLEIAREVLDLQGPPALLHRAVHTLLGPDARFRETDGLWQLSRAEPAAPDLATPLDELRWAVVDVETTGGGHRSGDRVTEVAVVAVEDGRVSDRWSSLVNPGRPIPPRVRALTGITDQMVAEAPPFDVLVPQVEARLAGRVFVAHNAAFDWGFVTAELMRTRGEAPELPRLCTVKAGRRLVPEAPRHSLGVLSRHLGIENDARHRALGDALATAELLLHLLHRAREAGLPDLGHLTGARTRPETG